MGGVTARAILSWRQRVKKPFCDVSTSESKTPTYLLPKQADCKMRIWATSCFWFCLILVVSLPIVARSKPTYRGCVAACNKGATSVEVSFREFIDSL